MNTQKANYIIFHPDNARQSIEVSAKAINNGCSSNKWKGKIWVDRIGIGNEDPFVFSEKWLYSYCHASQLRRNPSHCFLQKGSWLIFCSGNSANDGIIKVDTVFEVGKIHKWNRDENLKLPSDFITHMNNVKSELWRRHFKFPFLGIHRGVTYTYQAKIGNDNSFLPLTNGERTQLDFEDLPEGLKNKIERKVKGKYPVLINDDETKFLIKIIKQKAKVLVIGGIKEKYKEA